MSRELVHEILSVPRRAYVPFPGMRIIERPGWTQIITPAIRTGGLNQVSHSVLAEHEADRVIDETLAEYAALGLRFRWTVGPDSAPEDLADRLAQRGMTRVDLVGMARSTEPLEPDVVPRLAVVEVDHTIAGEFVDTMVMGWGAQSDQAALSTYVAGQLDQRPQSSHLFVARIDGVPVGSASYVAFERSAYLMGGVVLAGHRRQGIYRHLVAARLAHARARGLPLATCQAWAASSAPLLSRLGFESVVFFCSFSNR